jgi:serine/threonine-protein kinase
VSSSTADRNLLFGILALQMDFVSRDALISAMNAWVLQKDRSLADLLVDVGALALADRDLLEPLVRRHIEQHGNDASQSLASLSSVEWIRPALTALGKIDADVEQSLNKLAPGRSRTEADPTATASCSGSAGLHGPRFQILRLHARGGLGEVFVANDIELHREVALKQIQGRHSDHPDSRSRFLREAEITGGLEHPGIVPVYGLGHNDDGRPFYAMRFIKGDSLKEAIERFHRSNAAGHSEGERMLELQKLLRRFLDVCNAIAYAHSRGVLHRDIKPGNIMVGQYGETLVVDWGLAKVVGTSEASPEATLRPPSASGSSETLPGSAIGTPAFMSPEQAAGRLDQLGPASDVYSLGATLYCLLTGRAPFETTGLHIDEILDRVKRGDFPRPRQVRANVPRALEAICTEAMARLPEDRYASPRALADEIERWLADESVSAYREPWWSRLGRWVRRHKAPVAGAAAVLLTALVALTAGFVIVTLQQRETERQRARAERNFHKSSEAVDRFLTRIGQERLNDIPQMELLRGALLEDALEFRLGFLRERGDDASSLFDVAHAARQAADLQLQLNHLDDATNTSAQSIAFLDKLPAWLAREPSYRRERAAVLDIRGRLLATLGQTAGAETAYRQSIDLGSKLVDEQPGSAEDRCHLAAALDHLGLLLHSLGRDPEAEGAWQRGRALCENAPPNVADDSQIQMQSVAISNHLALLLKNTGRIAEAIALYSRAIQTQTELVRQSPAKSHQRDLLATLVGNLADALAGNKQYADAERAYIQARDLAEALRTDYPGFPRYQDRAAVTLHNLARIVQNDPKRFDEARDLLLRGISIQEKLVAAFPTVPDYVAHLGALDDTLAGLFRAQKMFDQTEELYRKSLARRSRLMAEHPQLVDYRGWHAQGLHNLADLLRERGRPREALPLQREAINQYQSLYEKNVEDTYYRGAYSYAYWTLCQIEIDLKDHRAASECVAKYLQIKPNGHEEALESAKFLCQCVELCRADSSIPAAERDDLARSYANRAMDALTRAVRAGFRDAKDLETSRTYEPLRPRAEFQRLVREFESNRKVDEKAQ